jgi:radical SAM protein with 4Fe4S-binding SPASM domain
MLKNFEIHCLAPWKSICIKPDGSVVPDIQARQVLGNLRNHRLHEILQSSHMQSLREHHIKREFHNSCANCHLKEKSGGRSRRTFFDDVLRPFVQEQNFKINAEPDIHFLEINASNKCNLKCRMCNGSISTSWIQEEKKLKDDQFEGDRGGSSKYSKLDEDILVRLFENREHFRNLQFLALRGGEPFVEPLNYTIIEKIIDWRLARQVVLDVSTNGTSVNDKLLSYFKEFKRVDLYISLEAIDAGYGYIRGGDSFSIKELEDNIKKLRTSKNTVFTFTVTTMIYNISKIVEIWNWFKKIRCPGDEISFSNTVVRPEYLNYQILPQDLKNNILNQIISSDLPQGLFDTGVRVLRDIGTPAILGGLKNESFFEASKSQHLRKQFKQFNSYLDKYRSSSFQETFPELASFYDSI